MQITISIAVLENQDKKLSIMREPVQVRQRKSCDDFKTTSECVWRKHIELTHTDNNKKKKSKPSTRLHCDSCDKYFYKKEKLTEHRLTMHKEDNL